MITKILQRTRTIVRAAAGLEKIYRPDLRVETERFGTDYGGWEVATGGLGGDSLVYSFGVGEDVSFDTALIDRFGLEVHAFDPTPRSIRWVERQHLPKELVHHAIGIAGHDGTASLHPPEDAGHVSHSVIERPGSSADPVEVPVRRLATIMEELGHGVPDILKMDIEGAEYEVIDDMAACGIRPGQVLVEFHHRMSGVGLGRTERAVEQLRSMGYALYSVSPSNEEFCFIRA